MFLQQSQQLAMANMLHQQAAMGSSNIAPPAGLSPATPKRAQVEMAMATAMGQPMENYVMTASTFPPFLLLNETGGGSGNGGIDYDVDVELVPQLSSQQPQQT